MCYGFTSYNQVRFWQHEQEAPDHSTIGQDCEYSVSFTNTPLSHIIHQELLHSNHPRCMVGSFVPSYLKILPQCMYPLVVCSHGQLRSLHGESSQSHQGVPCKKHTLQWENEMMYAVFVWSVDQFHLFNNLQESYVPIIMISRQRPDLSCKPQQPIKWQAREALHLRWRRCKKLCIGGICRCKSTGLDRNWLCSVCVVVLWSWLGNSP